MEYLSVISNEIMTNDFYRFPSKADHLTSSFVLTWNQRKNDNVSLADKEIETSKLQLSDTMSECHFNQRTVQTRIA